MRVLGIDYGTVRIGLALSDPTGLLAQGLSVLKRKSDVEAVADIADIVKANDVELIVVGLPRHMNGDKGDRALQCERFAESLHEKVGLPVEMYDERLTSVAAERMLVDADVNRKKRKQVVDAVAATILLQGFLDRAGNRKRQ